MYHNDIIIVIVDSLKLEIFHTCKSPSLLTRHSTASTIYSQDGCLNSCPRLVCVLVIAIALLVLLMHEVLYLCVSDSECVCDPLREEWQLGELFVNFDTRGILMCTGLGIRKLQCKQVYLKHCYIRDCSAYRLYNPLLNFGDCVFPAFLTYSLTPFTPSIVSHSQMHKLGQTSSCP